MQFRLNIAGLELACFLQRFTRKHFLAEFRTEDAEFA